MEDARSGEVSTEQLLQELNAYQDAGVDVARLVSGFAVAVAGGDVDTAALTGGNAAENNALCGGVCIGVLAVIVAGYTTYSGDGDLMQGLAVIGAGDDPLSQAVAAGTSAAVEWSATKYPDQTAAVLGVLEAPGNAIDATVTYVDEATGNEVSKRWNEIPEHTRNQIKGGAKIASIFVPAGSVKALMQLKTAGKQPGAAPQGKVNNQNLSKAFHYTETDLINAIIEEVLLEGSYGTPNGDLSPLQASIELALPPNRNSPKAKLKIDLDAMRKNKFQIPKPTRFSNTVTVRNGRIYTRPGGGYEMKFDYPIPPKYITVVE